MKAFMNLMTVTEKHALSLYEKNKEKLETYGVLGSGLTSQLVERFIKGDFPLNKHIVPVWSSEGFKESKRYKGRIPHIAFVCTEVGIEPLYVWLREIQKEFSYFSSHWVIETYYSNVGMGEEYYTVHEFSFKHYLNDEQKAHLFKLLIEGMDIYLKG